MNDAEETKFHGATRLDHNVADVDFAPQKIRHRPHIRPVAEMSPLVCRAESD